MNLKLLKQLSEIAGIPAHEKDVSNLIVDEIKNYSEIDYDNLGSIIAKKGKNGPKILVGGHLDEVGLMVSKITKEGYIKFIPIGGWFSQVMLAQKWNIKTDKGNITAITGVKPPHLIPLSEREKTINIDDMYLDIGVDNYDEAYKMGIRLGQMITPKVEFEQMANNKYLLGKAFDNRIGSYVVIELLKQLDLKDNQLYGVFTVQEEVGLRGAKTSSYMVEPEIVFAVDTGLGLDVPGGDPEGQTLGKGPQILMFDGGLIAHRGLRKFVIDVAEELKIPYQEGFIKGGRTDAGLMHLAHKGAAALSICIPTRNMHSHTSVIHQDDVINTIKLLKEVILRLDKNKVDEILFNK